MTHHPISKRGKDLLFLAIPWVWLILVMAFLPGIASAAQATARWNSEPDAAGYKLYYGTQTGVYSSNADAGNATSYTVSNLSAGTTYYFALTAYNSAGTESGRSSEVSYKTSCTYSISPGSATVAATGGTGNVAVTTQSGCTWSVTNNTPWISITSGASGTGNGTVAYSATANTGTAARSAAITIAGNTFSLNQSGSVAATYTITASAGAGGSISPQSATVKSGGSQSFTITASSGYQISNVTVDGTSVGAVSSYTFSNVTANHAIAATFSSTSPTAYTITASAETGGSISPSGAVKVNQGSNASFAITPAAGYVIKNVMVDGTAQGPVGTYTFTNIQANHTIAAQFDQSGNDKTKFTLKVIKTGPGAISHSPAGLRFKPGTVVTLKAKPTPHSNFVNWSGACAGSDPTCQITMDGDQTVNATFIRTYHVSVAHSAHGEISPGKGLRVAAGGSVTFTITPEDGYTLKNVFVDGHPVGAVTTYTFADIDKSHSIRAVFRK